MPSNFAPVLDSVRSKPHQIDTLVESRRFYNLEHAELNIYETLEVAHSFSLKFSHPTLASMLKGKKMMHLRDQTPFEFLPGESIVLPANECMKIDFPEATWENPTQCLALAISDEQIEQTLQMLNESFPRTEKSDIWHLEKDNFHFTNDNGIYQTLTRLIQLFMEDNPAKDFFAKHTLQELLIRILQTRARTLLIDNCEQHATSNRLAYAVKYIKEHLQEPISIDKLCDEACMSQAHFFRCFKNEFGMTPIEFVTNERIEKAKSLLKRTKRSISEISYDIGFSSVNYFVQVFKKHENITPGRFRKIEKAKPAKSLS
ncbi:MAG: AraC family transcriptional regulator [Bernardetiaceae bacterium]|nr:AraC family transcriptional regulator [Bernardetiaceae bacterium]